MLEKIKKWLHCATGPAFADSVALQKVIEMCPVLASLICTFLEDVLLS